MFKKLTNKKILKNQKGLTLVELLAVIVILAIISAIAIPSIGNIVENSRYNAVKADAINVLNAATLYYTDNPEGEATVTNGTGSTTATITVTQLLAAKYLETAGKMPDGASVAIGNPKKLSSNEAINYSGGKTVTFNTATIDLINKDPKKGSTDGNKVIGPTP